MNRLWKAILILNLEILLLMPNCVQQKIDRGVKSTVQYWQETGLNSKELETLLSPQSCQADEQGFLACVNSIGQMAEKLGLVLDLNGSLRPLTKADIQNRSSEKKDLGRWSALFSEKSKKINFIQLWKEIEEKHVQPSEKAYIIAVGLNGFLSVYKDPHTYLMPIAMFDEVIANSENRNFNAGFVARKGSESLLVRKVLPGSPAAKAGLRKGDRILSINGDRIDSLLASQISDFIRMRNVERLTLQVKRNKESRFIEILRSELTYPSVSAEVLESPRKVGLITIHKFSKQVCKMTKEHLISLKEQNIKGLLLDLRDNPGGQVDEAACIAGLFVEPGVLLFETRYLDLTRPSDRYVSDEKQVYKGPLAVIINSGSASASEIVAGALREQNRARLVGERSFGKGTFQDGVIWGPNPKIALFQTEGLYYFPSGWTPQLVGLQPDVQVNFNSGESTREEDLFYSPLVPVDSWAGPQSLSWLTEKECDLDADFLASTTNQDDPQLQKAQAYLSCGGSSDRNGSL